MKTYLLKIFNSKNQKNHFVIDIVEANNIFEAELKLIGKTYYSDSKQNNILGICRKAEFVNEII